MSKRHEITSEISTWIREQRVFFVATAPSALDGHVNVSPKGGDSFRVLGPLEVVYQDFTGSGAETAAHARENGRIVVMFCAFEGPPKIVRIHGHATLITVEDPRYAEFAELFPANPGTRAFIHIRVDRVSDSCGYSVPLYQFQRQRETLDRWASAKTPEGLKAYRAAKNRHSIDGLPALLPETSTTNAHPLSESKGKSAKLFNSTVVFLVGNIEAIMPWYQGIGFEASYFPPGFCILCRDAVQIFLQQQDGYTKPEDPAAQERGAWNVYIETDNVAALFEEISARPDAKITRGLTRQEYGQIEFEVIDPNGYVLVFAQPSAS
jgi:pyridoxamine 5'-phosphate oxidase-like protein